MAARVPLIVEVFQHLNFHGRNSFVIEPVQHLRQIGLNDQISSLKVYRGPNFSNSNHKVILYEHPRFRGRKIAFGPGLPKNLLDLDNTIEENINLLSDSLKKKINELTVCLLKRPRHTEIINKLKSLNVKIEYITDGDVSASILAADKSSTIDLYIGIGGAPEGVFAAAALDCLGGQMQTRLFFNNQDEEVRAKKMGVKDIRKKLNIEDMIKGDVMFCATAITDGNLLKGISKNNDKIIANTLALHKNSKIIKKVSNEFKI